MLQARLLYGFLMIAAFLAILVADLWFAPYYPLFAVLFSIVTWLAAQELSHLIRVLPIPVSVRFSQWGSLVIGLATWWAAFLGEGSPVTLNLLPPLAVLVLFGMLAFLLAAWQFHAPGTSVLTIAGHLLIFFYVGVLGSFVAQVRWLHEKPLWGTVAFLLMVFTAKFCDIGAYFTGRFLGRHKLSPTLSPGKTWEGSCGGLLTAVAIAWCGARLGEWMVGEPILPDGRVLLFGVVIGLTAQIGDLMESLIKRDCQRKDASSAIPGFGGVLDVVDSILFCGPVAYLFFSLA
ncbi:MAG: phosphatidate cytidylyltransferase [Planctomycetota bacterium]